MLVNYLTDVLPVDRAFKHPPCKNPACGKELGWQEYLLMRKCPNCAHRPALRTYIVMVLSLVMAVYIWIDPPLKMGLILANLVFYYLLLVALIDLETRLILRPLSIFGLVLCAIAGFWMQTRQYSPMQAVINTLLGALAGFAIMAFFYWLGRLFTHLRNKRLGGGGDGEEALGSGDVTLATILGLLLGWPLIWFNLLLGILLAGAFSLLLLLGLLVTRKYKSLMVFIAYGPFFIIVALILLYLPGWVTAFLPAG